MAYVGRDASHNSIWDFPLFPIQGRESWEHFSHAHFLFTINVVSLSPSSPIPSPWLPGIHKKEPKAQ